MTDHPDTEHERAGAGQEGGDPGEPYVHDHARVALGADLVDAAYREAGRWWDVANHLRAEALKADIDPGTPLVRELILAVSYRLRLGHRGEAACDLVPATDTEHFAWPPRVAEVSSPLVDLWRDVAGLLGHPAACARFNDLLFVRRDGVGRDRALAAVAAYLAGAQLVQTTDLDVTAFLVRAWDLARRVSGWELLRQVYTELVTRVDAEMSETSPKAGCVLPMIAALSARPTRAQLKQAPESIPDPATVNRLLETAFVMFKPDYLSGQIASLMRARTSDQAEIDAINRREVTAILTEAAAATGMTRQFRLQQAIKVARSHGLHDLARQATAELQKIPVKDLGLRRQVASIRIPRDTVESFLDAFTVSPEWRDGLRFFLNTSCPTGDLQELQQEAQDIAKVAAFASAVARTILGADGLPRWTTASDEDRQAERVASIARIRAENQGRVLAEGLGRMTDRYGIPAEPDLAMFLSSNGQADQPLTLSLARAFRHYWSGDYEACVHITIPKIEAAARAMLRELDEGIYRLQVAQSQGQYPGLYALLQELENLALDESWAYFLRWLLLGPPGMNIRNDIAHGFVTDISPVYAALVLRAAALLITITAPQPPSAVRWATDQDHDLVDLAELPERDRDDILALLAAPIGCPAASPVRDGLVGRVTGITASALRGSAAVLQFIARRLEP